jgi:uncharacterized integral membrane protein
MRWVLFVPLLILLALFALSNQQEVQIRLWPFDVVWVSALGIAGLLIAAVAFLAGALVVWGATLPARRRAGRLEQAARLMEGELAAYKAKEERAQREAAMGRVPDAAVVPASTALAAPARR